MSDRQKITKAPKAYLPVRCFWLVGVMALLTVFATVLCAITRSDLYTNLAGFLGVYFIALGVVAVVYAVVNISRIPSWGFMVGPAVLTGAIGVICVMFTRFSTEVFLFYSAYGVLAIGALVMSYGFLMKGMIAHLWIILLVFGGALCGISVGMLLYPYHGWLSPLDLTTLAMGFAAVALGLCAVFWALTQRNEHRLVQAMGKCTE